jgi:hypothetical protein
MVFSLLFGLVIEGIAIFVVFRVVVRICDNLILVWIRICLS